jgi:uncharacterized membrane protein YkvA (DUF1232 family)
VRNALIAVGILLAIWAVAIAALWLFGRRLAATQLTRAIPDLVGLARGLLGDPRVPVGSKVLVGAALVWLLSPIDLVPEFIPVAGPLDDFIVVAIVLRHLVKRAGTEVVQEHWRGDPRVLPGLAPRRPPATAPGVTVVSAPRTDARQPAADRIDGVVATRAPLRPPPRCTQARLPESAALLTVS